MRNFIIAFCFGWGIGRGITHKDYTLIAFSIIGLITYSFM